MTGVTLESPIYREPGVLARLFVYAFALTAPLLTFGGVLLPAVIVVRRGSDAGTIILAVVATLAYAALVTTAVRRVRVLAGRFTPPLPLPGDIWNIGVAPPPRRSRNWPIRLFRRRPPGGKPAERLAA